MPSLSLSRVFKYTLLALLIAGPHCVFAKPLVLPQEIAVHFCQLLVSDGGSLLPISIHAHRTIQPEDSLSIEQIFAGYILLADGWQTMRLFPHQEDGVVTWYSADDELPASMGLEHQKYIRKVFPRLVAEVQAGDWETVDAYIDRMIQYQCQFGGSKLPARPSSAAIIGIFLLFFVSFMMQKLVFQRKTVSLTLFEVEDGPQQTIRSIFLHFFLHSSIFHRIFAQIISPIYLQYISNISPIHLQL